MAACTVAVAQDLQPGRTARGTEAQRPGAEAVSDRRPC